MFRGGAGHFIAILNQSADDLTMGDPLKGKMVIKKAALADYFQFTRFFLEVRSAGAPPREGL